MRKSGETVTCVIMFVDIAGSTRLFESLGDPAAQRIITRYLELLSGISRREGGTVIKRIGDEIMTRFPRADAALMAACQMQKFLNEAPPLSKVPIAVRIGLHWGPALMEDGDLFGDTVHVAARLTGIAKARQILTTEEVVRKLPAELSIKARKFDRANLKGKQDAVTLYEVVWEEGEDVTSIMQPSKLPLGAPALHLRLRYRDKETSLEQSAAIFVIGRGSQCDLVVRSQHASRVHARIECRRGRFVLIDQSTNGTFVRTHDGRETYLRREEFILWGDGVIGLEKTYAKTPEDQIRFSCR